MIAADRSLRGRTAVVGAATFGLGEAPGFEAIELAAKASLLALADAGVPLREVDGLFICLPQDMLSTLAFAEYLGVRPTFSDNNRTGGSAFLTHVETAALALDAGLCDVALIAYGSTQRSASGKLVSALVASVHESAYRPLMPIAGYALAASRHMHEFGTTREQLAAVAVAARKWAQLNPEAFARDELTVGQCLASRMVADPLTVRDCCLVTDGAAAIVMTRADRARALRRPPIYLLGAGSAITHKEIANMPVLTSTGARESGARAYAQAGLSASEIDMVQLYDAFTINTVLFLEDLGFCAKGEGGPFVADGRIAPGGALPVNTNGGGLSCTHPGMYGLFTIVEAVRQLRGEAGERQVAGAATALCHGNGGVLSSQATNILGIADAL
jgi:acetyl-CoA acetyltransferase